MNKKNVHIFTGIDTDSGPLVVKAEKAEEIHNLRITNAELSTSDSSLSTAPKDPQSLVLTPEVSTIPVLLKNTSDFTVKGTYVGHKVCNDWLVIFSFDSENDYIIKYHLDNKSSLELDSEVTLAVIKRKEGEHFDVEYPIESLFCYENDKIQRLYWVDGLNQPRSINIYTDSSSSVINNYNSLNFSTDISNIKYDIDITNISSSNGTFKPGTIQYAFTLLSTNDAESSIFYISPMYYLSDAMNGESTENIVHNMLRIHIKITKADIFKKIKIYAVTKTSSSSITCRLLTTKPIYNNVDMYIDDIGTDGAIEDFTSLLYKGSENITAYTLDQKDGTLFLGKLKYLKHDGQLPELKSVNVDHIGVDYYGKAVYDYATTSGNNGNKYRYNNDIFQGTLAKRRTSSPSYIPYSPFSARYYTDNRDNTRSSRAVKRFKSGEYYKIGIIGQYKNGKMTDVLPVDIVYNPYKPIFKQDEDLGFLKINKGSSEEGVDVSLEGSENNDISNYHNQIPCYITTGFRLRLSEKYLEDCKGKNIYKLYPVVVYPTDNYKAVLTQGLLSPTVFNIGDTSLGYPNNIPSWFYRPYAKGILRDTYGVQLGDPSNVGIWYTTLETLNNKVYAYPNFHNGGDNSFLIHDNLANLANNNIYNFACITSGAHYRGLYSSAFPNGEIETNIIGSPIDYVFITGEGQDLYKKPSYFTLRYGPHNLRLDGPVMYYANDADDVDDALMPSKDYVDVLGDNFLMDCHVLTLNSPETEQEKLFLNATRGNVGNDYKLRIVGYSDYCYNRILERKSKEDSKLYTRSDLQYGFELSKYAKYSNGSYESYSYLTNRSVDDTALEGIGKAYYGNIPNGKDNGFLKLPNVYLGDIAWGFTDQDRYNNTLPNNPKVSSYLSFGTTDYYIVEENSKLKDILKDYKYVTRNANARLQVERFDGTGIQEGSVDFTIGMSNNAIAASASTRHTPGDYFNSLTHGKRGVRYTKMYNYESDSKNCLYTSWASSIFCAWHHNDAPKGPKGDYDTVETENKKLAQMEFDLPYINWWKAYGKVHYTTYTESEKNTCTFDAEENTYYHNDGVSQLKITDDSYICIHDGEYIFSKNPYTDGKYHCQNNPNILLSISETDNNIIFNVEITTENESTSPLITFTYSKTVTETNIKGADTVPSETQSGIKYIHTLFDYMPIWTTNYRLHGTTSTYEYSKHGMGAIPLTYTPSGYIVLSLKSNTDYGDYVLCNDGYGLDKKEDGYPVPYWVENKDKPYYYYCKNIISNLYGYYDSVGQFIGEFYRDAKTIGIKFDEYGNVDLNTSTYMGGKDQDPYNNWYICGEGVDVNTKLQLLNYYDKVNKVWDEEKGLELLYLEGDSYIGRYDSLKSCPSNEADQGIVEIYSTVLESSMNLDERIEPRDSDIPVRTHTNHNKFNEQAYNQTSGIQPYHAEDTSVVKVDNLPNTVTWSMQKFFGAEVDEWAHITMLNTLDLDGQYGVIEYLTNFNNNIFAFQNQAISLVNFNSRVQIPTNDNNPIEITNGYKVDGKTLVSTSFGSSNKWSIVNGYSGIFFVDDMANKICLFNGQSTAPIPGVQRFLDSKHISSNLYYNDHLWNPSWDDIKYCRAGYDSRRRDVYFIYNDLALVFNEYLNSFVGTFDYGKTQAMFNIGDFFGSIYGQNVYELLSKESTSYCKLYGNDICAYRLSYVENGNSLLDKVFNTIEWQENNVLNSYAFNSLTVDSYHNKYTDNLNYGYRGNAMRRYNYNRAFIYKEDLSGDKPKLRYRLRNPYFKITLQGENDLHNPFIVTNVITTFTE